MPEDLVQSLTALLNRLTATPYTPHEQARRLLVEPLKVPKKKGVKAREEEIRTFLFRSEKRVYGLAEEFPDAPWLAEINRDEGVVVLSADALFWLFEGKVQVTGFARELGLPPGRSAIQDVIDEAIAFWRANDWIRNIPARTVVPEPFVALSLEAVAGSFETL